MPERAVHREGDGVGDALELRLDLLVPVDRIAEIPRPAGEAPAVLARRGGRLYRRALGDGDGRPGLAVHFEGHGVDDLLEQGFDRGIAGDLGLKVEVPAGKDPALLGGLAVRYVDRFAVLDVGDKEHLAVGDKGDRERLGLKLRADVQISRYAVREAEGSSVLVVPARKGRAGLLRRAGDGCEIAVFDALGSEHLFPDEEADRVGLDRIDRLDRQILRDRSLEIKVPAHEAVSFPCGRSRGGFDRFAVIDRDGIVDRAVRREGHGIGLDLEERRDRHIARHVREVGVPAGEGVAVFGGIGGILRRRAVGDRLGLVGRAVHRENHGVNDGRFLLPGGEEVKISRHGGGQIVGSAGIGAPADKEVVLAFRVDAGGALTVRNGLGAEQHLAVVEADGILDRGEDREEHQILAHVGKVVRPAGKRVSRGNGNRRSGRARAVLDVLGAADLFLLRVEEHNGEGFRDIADADHRILADIGEAAVKAGEDRALFFGDRGFLGVLAVADRLFRDHLVPVHYGHGEGADPEERGDGLIRFDRGREIELAAVLVKPAEEDVALAGGGAGNERRLTLLDQLGAAVAGAVVVQEGHGVFLVLDRDVFREKVDVVLDREVEVVHRGVGGIEIPADENVVILRRDLGEGRDISVGDVLRLSERFAVGIKADRIKVGQIVDPDLAVRNDPLGHAVVGVFPVDRVVRDIGQRRQVGVPAVHDLLRVEHRIVGTEDHDGIDRVGQDRFDRQISLYVGIVAVPFDEGFPFGGIESGRRDGVLPRFDALAADGLALHLELNGIDLRQRGALSEREPFRVQRKVLRDRRTERETVAVLQRPAEKDRVLFFGRRRHDGVAAVDDLLFLSRVGNAVVKPEGDGVRFGLSRNSGESEDAEQEAADERRQKDANGFSVLHIHVPSHSSMPRATSVRLPLTAMVSKSNLVSVFSIYQPSKT